MADQTDQTADPTPTEAKDAKARGTKIACGCMVAFVVLFVIILSLPGEEGMPKAEVAQRLAGSWRTADGSFTLSFDFSGGDRGTVTTSRANGSIVVERMRVGSTHAENAAIAVGPDVDHEIYYQFFFTDDDPNVIGMQAPGQSVSSALSRVQ